ncbi:iron export ABC transporter permease subunit FetB [Brevibacterium sp. R8603A2]|uniref:ABC transporter permease n=1 Tax=Brevibacterium sp. R8603A2 TaxID=2929779 RepID=UPI001FF82910|nr:iron export ABC transporter permease subunit FetB [Brevibacterium sp. R8603A2]MCK1802434.1 iron export ABC transporter permease subunit FetB [Brevibacterium sp. R8603A2]
MSGGLVVLGWPQVGLAFVMVLVVLLLMVATRVGRRGEMLWACLRMTVQLVLVGLVLGWVFAHPSWWLTGLIFALMQVFAVATILGKFRGRLSRALRRVVVLASTAGTTGAVAWFLFVVVGLGPWYEPRYVIPIAGMLIGNSMTGITLGLKALVDGMRENRDAIEDALGLGAAPRAAIAPLVRSAFESALMPTINSMLGTGIVFLPGMMTGQILAGVDPMTAIGYQIAILLGIVGAVGTTVFLALVLGARTYFDARDRLRDDRIR